MLATLGGTALAPLAGCAGDPTPDDPPAPGVDSPPEPGDHVDGADGEWSSVGCNAAGTRAVTDGRAPVDGVSERWRVEVPQLWYQEPLAADEHVLLPLPDRLRVLDADDGTEQWRLEADSVATPLVHDGTVYASLHGTSEARDVADGTVAWERDLGEGTLAPPATYDGDQLYVGAGERLHALDPATGETAWSRRLLGRIEAAPAIYSGHLVVVVTAAGKLYALDDRGTAWGQWDLPAAPHAPLTAGRDGLYVNCADGHTRGVVLENQPRHDVDWSVETGWADGGLAVGEAVYAAVPGGLTAVDPETGESLWQHDTGDWRHTAPALARDTLFVGGDGLHALDPTPSGGGSGPATRFTETWHGRVGPGPVVNDGTLYVVAETDAETYHLLALE